MMEQMFPKQASESAGNTNSLYRSIKTPFHIERVSNTTPHSMPKHHYHDAYELYYLYSGDRSYFIENETYHITRGSLVLIKPYQIHSTRNFAKSGYNRILITLKKEFLEDFSKAMGDVDFFRCFDGDSPILLLDFSKQSYIESLLFSMLEEYRNKAAGYEYVLQAAMAQFMLLVCRYAEDGKSNPQHSVSEVHKHVSAAIGYINSHYAEPISLAAITEDFFVSQSHFSRIFKRITGVSFTQYVNGVRIKEAQRLLKSERMSITTVSEAVGYTNLTHFGRVFKSITGVSPQEYKRIQGNA